MVVRASRVLVGRCRGHPDRSCSLHTSQRNTRCLLAGSLNAPLVGSTSSLMGKRELVIRKVTIAANGQQHVTRQHPVSCSLTDDRTGSVLVVKRALSIAPRTGRKSFDARSPEAKVAGHGCKELKELPGEPLKSPGVGPDESRTYSKRCHAEELAKGDEEGEQRESISTEARQLEQESSRVWTVPNIITMGRMAFCPVLAGLIVTSQHELALAGLLGASLTDWLDGFIARRWNQKSVLGGFLDPLADKVMVTTVALALGQQGIIPAPLVALVVGRDVMLIGGALAHRYRTRREGEGFFDYQSLDYTVSPSILSKVNTALQFGTLWLGLTNAVYHVPGDTVFSSLCLITGGATLASGANYLLESGLKPTGELGSRLMDQRENLQERYREGEVRMREQMGARRERLRAKQGELKERLRKRRAAVTGALKTRVTSKTDGHYHSGR